MKTIWSFNAAPPSLGQVRLLRTASTSGPHPLSGVLLPRLDRGAGPPDAGGAPLTRCRRSLTCRFTSLGCLVFVMTWGQDLVVMLQGSATPGSSGACAMLKVTHHVDPSDTEGDYTKYKDGRLAPGTPLRNPAPPHAAIRRIWPSRGAPGASCTGLPCPGASHRSGCTSPAGIPVFLPGSVPVPGAPPGH